MLTHVHDEVCGKAGAVGGGASLSLGRGNGCYDFQYVSKTLRPLRKVTTAALNQYQAGSTQKQGNTLHMVTSQHIWVAA